MHDRVLLRRYRLIDQLGQGGMGSVWRALDLTLKNEVAIKLIDPAIAESPEILERFQREALAAAELRSTHIVQVIDYGVDEGTPFIAMELLEGESLAGRLDRLRLLTLEDTTKILSQVARALARAHEKGTVHRDLKPDNIFIVREGDEEVTKVLDFGIAKKLDALRLGSSTKTRTGALLGTPYYMSPEQALGRTNIDHRTDIWSMGVIAYECLTGIRPFESESVGALLMSICHEPLPTPSSVAAVNPAFDAWFARAAAREPSTRFQSAVEAATALRAIGNAQAPFVSTNAANATNATNATDALPAAATVVRHDPVALLETIGAASVTVAGRTRRKAPSVRAWSIGMGLGLTAIGALILWQKPSLTAPTLAASSPAPTIEPAQMAAPTATTLQASIAPKAQPSPAETPKGAGASSAPTIQGATYDTSPAKKTLRRSASRRHENPAGF